MPKFHPVHSHIEIPTHETWADTDVKDYKVSTKGVVRSMPRTRTVVGYRNGKKMVYKRRYKGRIIAAGCATPDRHRQVLLGKGVRRLVHRLVLEAFVGPCPPGMECRHLNGKPWDNRLENLAWGTTKENVEDMIRHGTKHTALGESCSWSKLSDKLVREIRRAYAKGGVTQGDLARKYGVIQVTISQVLTGKTWKHVT